MQPFTSYNQQVQQQMFTSVMWIVLLIWLSVTGYRWQLSFCCVGCVCWHTCSITCSIMSDKSKPANKFPLAPLLLTTWRMMSAPRIYSKSHMTGTQHDRPSPPLRFLFSPPHFISPPPVSLLPCHPPPPAPPFPPSHLLHLINLLGFLSYPASSFSHPPPLFPPLLPNPSC